MNKIGKAGLAEVIALAETGITKSQDNDRLARLMKVEASIRKRVENGKMTPAEALSISRYLRKSQQSADESALKNAKAATRGSQVLESAQDQRESAAVREKLDAFDHILIENIQDHQAIGAFRTELARLLIWEEIDHAHYASLKEKLDIHTESLSIEADVISNQAGKRFASFSDDTSEREHIQTFLDAQTEKFECSQESLTVAELAKRDTFKPGGGSGIPV